MSAATHGDSNIPLRLFFLRYDDECDGCWPWIGGVNHQGYGKIAPQHQPKRNCPLCHGTGRVSVTPPPQQQAEATDGGEGN